MKDKVRVLLMLMLLISVIPQGYSQRYNIDSLETELQISEPDTNRVNVLVQLIAAYFIDKRKDLALEKSAEAIELAEQLSYQKGLSVAWFRRGIIFHRGQAYQNALECYEIDLKLREYLGDLQGAIGTINNIGIIQSKVLGDQGAAQKYYNKALGFALQLKDSVKLPHIYTNLGISFELEGIMDSAKVYYHLALENHLKLGNVEGAANTYNNLANAYKNQGQLEEAFEGYQNALELYAETKSVEGRGNTWMNIGGLYVRIKEYESGIHAYYKALTIFEEGELPKSIANVYGNLSTVYRDLRDLEEAKTLAARVLALRREIGVNNGILLSLNVIASIHLELNEYDQAIHYIDQGIDLATEINNDFQIATFQYLMGDVSIGLGSFDKALAWYDKADAISQKLDNMILKARIALGRAKTHIKMVAWKQGVQQGEVAYRLATTLKNIELVKQASEVLSIAYAEVGEFAMAYRYQKEFKVMNDSILNEEAVKTVTRINLEQAFEQERLRVEQDRLIEKTAMEATLTKQEKFRNYSLIALGVFIVLCFIIYWVYRREKNYAHVLNLKSKDLEEKNRQVQELTQFRNSLTQMIAHDMKNPLNVIISMANNFRKNEDLQEIAQSGKMMLQMVHNMLDIQKFEETKMELKEVRIQDRLLNIKCISDKSLATTTFFGGSMTR
ncbi:MAG: tetratricopeptide repeat protein [Cytophagales bacterium]|nr:tetratricopeptide repeat protein [Cytophagales bacterium]